MNGPSHARALIAYEPPPGGQALRARDPRAALAATRRFLAACTAPAAPAGAVTLTIAEASALSPPGYDPEALLADAVSRFGVGERRRSVRRASDGATIGFAHAWTLPHDRLDAVADLLAAFPARRGESIPPARASVGWRALLVDPASGTVLPRQGPAHAIGGVAAISRVTLSLGARSRAALALRFPFARPDAAFLEYIGAVRPYVPVAIAWSRFHLLARDESGTRLTSRKLPALLFDGL